MFPNVDFPAADYLVSMVGQRQQQRLKPLRPISRVTCLLDLTGVNLLDLQSWWPRSNNHERNPSHPQQSSCFRFFRHRRCASVSISAAQRRHDLSVYLSWFIYLFFYFFLLCSERKMVVLHSSLQDAVVIVQSFAVPPIPIPLRPLPWNRHFYWAPDGATS